MTKANEAAQCSLYSIFIRAISILFIGIGRKKYHRQSRGRILRAHNRATAKWTQTKQAHTVGG
jgi:hypothetical protein